MNEDFDALSAFTNGLILSGEDTQNLSEAQIMAKLYALNFAFDRTVMAHLGLDSNAEMLNPSVLSMSCSAVEPTTTGLRLSVSGSVCNIVTGNAYTWDLVAERDGGQWTITANPAVAGATHNMPVSMIDMVWRADDE